MVIEEGGRERSKSIGGLRVNSSTELMDTSFWVSICGGKGMQLYGDLAWIILGGVCSASGVVQNEEVGCSCV